MSFQKEPKIPNVVLRNTPDSHLLRDYYTSTTCQTLSTSQEIGHSPLPKRACCVFEEIEK